MRGKHNIKRNQIFHNRITPADAGKTLVGVTLGTLIEDHPRGCGENMRIPFAQSVKLGSPPRMRGKRRSAQIGAL